MSYNHSRWNYHLATHGNHIHGLIAAIILHPSLGISTAHVVSTIKIWGCIWIHGYSTTTAKYVPTNMKSSPLQDLKQGWVINCETYSFIVVGQSRRNGTHYTRWCRWQLPWASWMTRLCMSQQMNHHMFLQLVLHPKMMPHNFVACCPSMNDLVVPSACATRPHWGKHSAEEELANEALTWYFLSQWPNARGNTCSVG